MDRKPGEEAGASVSGEGDDTDERASEQLHEEMRTLVTALVEKIRADPLKGAELLLAEILPQTAASLGALLDGVLEDFANTVTAPNRRDTLKRLAQLDQMVDVIPWLIAVFDLPERPLPPGPTNYRDDRG